MFYALQFIIFDFKYIKIFFFCFYVFTWNNFVMLETYMSLWRESWNKQVKGNTLLQMYTVSIHKFYFLVSWIHSWNFNKQILSFSFISDN